MEEGREKLSTVNKDRQSKPKTNTANIETAVIEPGPSQDSQTRIAKNRLYRPTKVVYTSNRKSNISQQKHESANPKIRNLQRPKMPSDKPKSPNKLSKQQPQQPAKNGYLKKDETTPQSPKPGPTWSKRDIQTDEQKAALKEQRLREKIARKRTESDLRSYFQNTRMTPGELVSKQFNERFLTEHIGKFMNHLQKRFSNPEISYTDLADKKHENYAFYYDRFLELIDTLNLPNKVKDNYKQTLEYYQNLHPPSIWQFRRKLLCIKEKVSEIVRQQHRQTMPVPRQEDLCMVTYKQVNPINLHKQICQLPDSEKLKHVIKEIALSDEGFQNLNRFVDALRSAIENSPIAELKVKVHPFGSLSNGLGTFDSDLDIVLQFNKVLSTQDRLDYETSLMILKIIKMILPLKLDVCRGLSKDVIVPSKRCPIIKLDFKDCFPKNSKKLVKNKICNINGQLAFNKCDISVTSTYGIHNSRLLKFLTLYDRRFYEMALLMKYWAKKNLLICTEGFSSYAFMMLIIFFLQTREPRILPPISQLQMLAKKHPEKFAPITVHGWQFGFANDIALIRKEVGWEENTQKTEQLIPEFFHFYYEFDYSTMAISTRIGAHTTKEALFAEKKSEGLEMAFKQTIVVIEDPFVLGHNPGSIFHSHYMPKWFGTLKKFIINWNVNEKNVIPLLTDPNRWDPTPPPKNKANKEEKKAARAARAKERKEKKMLSKQNAKNTKIR